jgi:hypothetical protein
MLAGSALVVAVLSYGASGGFASSHGTAARHGGIVISATAFGKPATGQWVCRSKRRTRPRYKASKCPALRKGVARFAHVPVGKWFIFSFVSGPNAGPCYSRHAPGFLPSECTAVRVYAHRTTKVKWNMTPLGG